jgi:hypothetical protein
MPLWVCTHSIPVNATAKIAKKDRKDSTLRPYHWYKAFVVAGAYEHGLPGSYVEWIETTKSIEDSDESRKLRNEGIL